MGKCTFCLARNLLAVFGKNEHLLTIILSENWSKRDGQFKDEFAITFSWLLINYEITTDRFTYVLQRMRRNSKLLNNHWKCSRFDSLKVLLPSVLLSIQLFPKQAIVSKPQNLPCLINSQRGMICFLKPKIIATEGAKFSPFKNEVLLEEKIKSLGG